jgi:CRP-like cAMP-binding protein
LTTVKEALAQSDIFKGLPDEWLIEIGELVEPKEYQAKEYLFLEGDEPTNMYIVQVGKVAMDLSMSPIPGVGNQTTVDTLTRGQTCGWSSVVGSPYSMTARCIDPVGVLAINGPLLRSLLDSKPEMGYKVMESMAWVVISRLRNIRMATRMLNR